MKVLIRPSQDLLRSDEGFGEIISDLGKIISGSWSDLDVILGCKVRY